MSDLLTLPDTLEIEVPAALSDAAVQRLAGQYVDASHYDVLITDGRIVTRTSTSEPHANVAVRKPDGSLLLVYRRDVLPRHLCATAYDVFSRVRFGGANRGMAGGLIADQLALDPGAVVKGSRYRPVKIDGTLSRTAYAVPNRSAITGFFDANPRFPFCRLTAFNIDHYEEFERARPFVLAVDRAFGNAVPERYAKQQEIARRTSPDFVIRDTTFTTVTINRNWRTALHPDTGDFKPGFGVMTVLQAGRYDGAFLVWPKYRVAVDMRPSGVCLADVHEYHGNTEILGMPGQYVRLSLVAYYRAGMIHCGSAAEELARAKHRRS